jgi:hypothetical protein
VAPAVPSIESEELVEIDEPPAGVPAGPPDLLESLEKPGVGVALELGEILERPGLDRAHSREEENRL